MPAACVRAFDALHCLGYTAALQWQDFYANLRQSVATYNGTIMAVPLGVWPFMLYVRRDWMEEGQRLLGEPAAWAADSVLVSAARSWRTHTHTTAHMQPHADLLLLQPYHSMHLPRMHVTERISECIQEPLLVRAMYDVASMCVRACLCACACVCVSCRHTRACYVSLKP